MELEMASLISPWPSTTRVRLSERATKHGINLDVTVDERLGDFKAMSARSNRYCSICFPTPEIHAGGRTDRNSRQAGRWICRDIGQ